MLTLKAVLDRGLLPSDWKPQAHLSKWKRWVELACISLYFTSVPISSQPQPEALGRGIQRRKTTDTIHVETLEELRVDEDSAYH